MMYELRQALKTLWRSISDSVPLFCPVIVLVLDRIIIDLIGICEGCFGAIRFSRSLSFNLITPLKISLHPSPNLHIDID